MKKTKENTVNVPVVPPKGNRDERKELLQESVNKYLEAIETQIGDLKKVGKNTLVIGGAIVAVYAITELLLPAPKRRIEANTLPIAVEEDEADSVVWSALKGAAMSLLLTVAKDKLLGLMNTIPTNNAESNS